MSFVGQAIDEVSPERGLEWVKESPEGAYVMLIALKKRCDVQQETIRTLSATIESISREVLL